jgi:ABC-type lipoprotein export system ATPase subunit
MTALDELERTARTKHREYGEDALIVCDNLVRIYQVDQIEIQALQGLDLLVEAGDMVAIVGASGSGKSTLLNVLSGLDVPTAGRARVGDWDLLRMTTADRLVYRREVVGFVWQQTGRNLLPYLNAQENVRLPMAFAGVRSKERKRRSAELLEALGVGYCAQRRPGEMSGGEQQRVAIATALANQPRVLFADEPTGELDSATGADVFAALRAANTELGATVVIVTHDAAVSEQVRRTVAIRDGRTSSETLRRTEIDEHGRSSIIAEEYAVLDRAGRVQLPKDYREALGLRDRVRLELEADHVGVWADGVRPAAENAAAEGQGTE